MEADLDRICKQSEDEWDLTDLAANGQPAIQGFRINQARGVVAVKVSSSRPDVAERLTERYGSSIEIDMRDWRSELY
jgi:hypothetical protein